MYNEPNAVIFHLKHHNGFAEFIHPFSASLSTLEIENLERIDGQYGSEPRVESLTALRNTLYRQTESDIRDWIYERRFIPRFLLSSGTFIVGYFFFALVIRDPIPFADEFLLSLGLSILTYILLGRRYQQSKGASEKRARIRERIDSVAFQENKFVHELETLLYAIETIPPEELTKLISGSTEDVLRIKREFPSDFTLFTAALENRKLSKWEKKISKALRRDRFTDDLLKSKSVKIAGVSLVILENILDV